jgi:hypothetical protein
MRRMPRTGGRRAVQRMTPYPLHPRRAGTSAHQAAFTCAHSTQPACAGKRTLQMALVEPAHEGPVL